MRRTLNRLSAVTVTHRKRAGLLADGGGLYLRVTASGSRGWIFRFTISGRTRDYGLGRYPAVSLVDARAAAANCRRLVASGIDPIDARRQAREAERLKNAKAKTFRQCAEAFIASHETAWKNAKHRAQWHSTLKTYVFPSIGDLPIQHVNIGHISSLLERIWNAKPETASRVRQRVEAVLNWARVKGFREGENPAAWRGHLDQLLPTKTSVRKVRHHPALPFDQIATFIESLRQQTSIAARALEFLVLTATRTGETLGATWDEFDLAGAVWTIPASRMKSGRAHRVPLSVAAAAVLEEMAAIRQSQFVFPGIKSGQPLSQMALLMLLRRIGYHSITVHGFRSTFRDWSSECTSCSREVAEMALAHVVGNAVEAAYRRGDLFLKRRQLMTDWGFFVAKKPARAAELAHLGAIQ